MNRDIHPSFDVIIGGTLQCPKPSEPAGDAAGREGLREPSRPSFEIAGDGVASSASSVLCAGTAGSSSVRRELPANHTYLGLDQDSRALPWARGHAGMEAPETGTRGLPAWIAPNGLPDLYSVQEGVHEFIFEQAREGVTHVISEKPYFDENRDVAEKLFTIRAAIAHACGKAGILLWQEVSPSKWRELFIGCSTAPKHVDQGPARRAWLKEAALETCKHRGWPVQGEHEAEAAGILNWGLCQDYPAYAQGWLELFYTRRRT